MVVTNNVIRATLIFDPVAELRNDTCERGVTP